MKIQFLSLLVVASAALARPTPKQDMSPSESELNRRALIGDEYTFQNQADNSYGKHTFRIDHAGNSGDSSVQKGLLYDLIDGQGSKRDQGDDGEFLLKRRSLLGNLFGGESMSISNVNDNSKHTQTMNQHGNRHTTIGKTIKESHGNGGRDRDSEISQESFFDRRDMEVEDKNTQMETREDSLPLERRGTLFGGDSASISNVNDNSQHSQIMNKHGNRDTTITTKINRQPPRSRGQDDMDADAFFDRRDPSGNEGEHENNRAERRSLFGDLFGGSSTTINNVNDNSQTKKIYNSHGNHNTQINKKIQKYSKDKRNLGLGGIEGEENEKRELLFGGQTMNIGSENDKDA